MRVSYRWLMRTLGGAEVPLAELLDRLTMLGLEVESVTDLGVGSGKIVTARILTRNQHPNADNLSLCDVSAGGEQPYRIVCGARNMGPGDLVPLAMEGASLPGGITIKKSKIRGETSQGMMCSGRELGWGDDHQGLLILAPETSEHGWYREGQPFDALIDIKVTPNRPDCLSLFGLARDLAAALGRTNLDVRTFTRPGTVLEEGPEITNAAQVRIEAPDACPKYLGRLIRGVKIGPSPIWLRRAVESAGLRSISNVVDVTNYILLELGQPLHAFDLAKVADHKVIVRYANEGEKVSTLDGQQVTLTSTDLLIADPEKPIALAGIMGCGNSEISDTTTDVFLECACFTPATIRRTSKRLAKSTDSSYRFERGIDWSAMNAVIDRAAQLIAEVSGGIVAHGTLEAGPGQQEATPIELTATRVNALLGAQLSGDEIEKALTSLGFTVQTQGGTMQVRVPAHRPDISRDADLVEEVARIRGYQEIKPELPHIQSRGTAQPDNARIAARLRTVLVANGFLEVTNFSFLSAEIHEKMSLALDAAVKLANPLSAEYSVMRMSLIPGLLETVAYNHNRGSLDLRLFETGKIYRANKDGGSSEESQFAAALSGHAAEQTWRSAARNTDFFDGKAVAEAVLGAFEFDECTWGRPDEGAKASTPEAALLHPGKSAIAQCGGAAVLVVGELHPRLKETLDLKRDVVLLFANFDALKPNLDKLPAPQQAPQFPAIARDLALVADITTPAAAIEQAIARRAKSILAGIRLFDVYEGERIGTGKRSLAYQLRFAAPDRTLTDAEVNPVIEKVLADLKDNLGVELRQ